MQGGWYYRFVLTISIILKKKFCSHLPGKILGRRLYLCLPSLINDNMRHPNFQNSTALPDYLLLRLITGKNCLYILFYPRARLGAGLVS